MNSLGRLLILSIYVAVCMQCSSSKVNNQSDQSRTYWHDTADDVQSKLNMARMPEQYRLLKMNLDLLKASVTNTEEMIIVLPGSEHGFFSIKVKNSSVMSPELSAKYPDIRSFRGIELTEDLLDVRVDINTSGFFAMVTTRETSYFIHPVSTGSDYYVCYDKRFAKRNMDNPFYDAIKNDN